MSSLIVIAVIMEREVKTIKRSRKSKGDEDMKLCRGDRCRWYSDPSKYGRKCYYEPNCWRGWIDVLVLTIRLGFTLKAGK